MPPVDEPAPRVSEVTDVELQAELEKALSRNVGEERRVARIDRRPCPYRTSFAIEEVDATLEDGMIVRLVFKDLSRESLSKSAEAVKPLFLYDPLREIEAYDAVLAPAALGTATYHGSVVDQVLRRYWLFIENVPGIALWQIGELETWMQVARWLAALHDNCAHDTHWQEQAEHLLCYDTDFYRLWPERAAALDPEARGGERPPRRSVRWLAGHYDVVLDRLTALPDTFIHGDFYPSNVLVAETTESTRVCPIDWEIAGVGPGLLDLAALTMGGWNDGERDALALAYRDASTSLEHELPSPEDFLTALDYCRLHVAVQWLGWAPNWTPPPEHRQDWLAEALRVAEKLGL
jgi:Ser/Thr protein kinase RdoA (MazF antagonist)